jgi:hypothetical protein
MEVEFEQGHLAHAYNVDVLKEMTDDAVLLIQTAKIHPDLKLMQEFFGKRTVPDKKSDAYKTICQDTQTLTTWCANGDVRYISKNVKGSLAACDLADNKREFWLNDAFPMMRWSWGERVGTLLHEFSHKALKTKDYDYKGSPALGLDQCRKMAKDPSNCTKTLTNAESWGYYLCLYRVQAKLTKASRDAKWKWLHPSDWNGGRTKFLSDVDGQKLDPSLLEGTSKGVSSVVAATVAPSVISKTKKAPKIPKTKKAPKIPKTKKATKMVVTPKTKRTRDIPKCEYCGDPFTKVSLKYHRNVCSKKPA